MGKRKETYITVQCPDCKCHREVTERGRSRASTDFCRKCIPNHKAYPTVAEGRKPSVYKPGVWSKHSGKNSPYYTGSEHISGTTFHKWRKGAAERSLAFEVSLDDLEALWTKQNGKCAYTDIELTDARNQPGTVSLDRIDNDKGYLTDNVQFVCAQINFMKHTMPHAEFVNWCTLVAQHTTRSTT
jgi:hypothetical protein